MSTERIVNFRVPRRQLVPQRIDCIRAAAFDLDGTLVDTAPDLAAAANAMLDDLGHALLAQERIEAMIGEGIEKLVARALAEATGSPASPGALTDAIRAFRRYYARHLFERSRIYPGVVDGLRALAARRIALCVVTNKPSAFTRPLLEAAGLSELFRLVLCADRPEDRKPSPNLLIAACAQLGVRPDELLYVGDSRIDVATALAAGCPSAVVGYGYGGDRAVENARYTLDSIAEIVTLPEPGGVLC